MEGTRSGIEQGVVEAALDAFQIALGAAAFSMDRAAIRVEFSPAPHAAPSRLPPNTMAVYGFFHGSDWLKIGKVGPNSSQRYVHQHYKEFSAGSTLAASLLRDERYGPQLTGCASAGAWIKSNVGRVNLLLPSELGSPVLGFLESFLQLRFKPMFEGKKWI